MLASTMSSSDSRSAGITIVIDLPTASSAVYPNRSSAPLFQDVMMPFRSLLTIASSDDSTMAASLSVGSGGRMILALSSSHVAARFRSHAATFHFAQLLAYRVAPRSSAANKEEFM